MRDRHGGALRPGRGLDLGVELMRQRLDDAGGEPGFFGWEAALLLAGAGTGKKQSSFPPEKSGLGTGIIKALSHQLDAQVETTSGPEGTTVSITHATFPTKAEQTEQAEQSEQRVA